MMIKTAFFEDLYSRYGTVTRARGCFLYTKKGVRLTDLYQEGGRAILGWEGGSAFTFLKNVLSRGQTGSFICEEKSRLEKSVSELFASDRKLFIFYSRQEAISAALLFSPDKTSFFRPWNITNEKINIPEIDCIIFEPPLPWSEPVYILALASRLFNEKNIPDSHIKGAVTLPFALQAAYTKSIYNLIKALQERQEKDWFIYDPILTKYWNRQGPYLIPKIPEDKYADFALHCLDCGIVVSPYYNTPSIIPFGADRGVFTKLKNSPFEY